MFGLESVGNLISKGLDKWIPDANVREQAKAELTKQVFEEMRLIVADRDSARKREIEVKDRTPSNLAYSYTVGYFATLGVVFFHGVPAEVHDFVNFLLGIMSAAQMAIMQYYFGSSHGSDKKNAILAELGVKK